MSRQGLLALAVGGLLIGWAALAQDGIALSDRRSGTDFLAIETRAMQEDEASNPGYLAVARGQSLWREPAGTSAKACAGCHGDAAQSMRGVAVRYPAIDQPSGRLLNLEGRIRQCRTARQGGAEWSADHPDLIALATYVASLSRGEKIAPAIDGPAARYFELGKQIYYTRLGQFDMSCDNCHQQNWGKRMRGEVISQGQATGYPIYRLDWQGMGSLYRRLRSCFNGVRAEPYPQGSDEHLGLELFLAWRARGMALETPAVRR